MVQPNEREKKSWLLGVGHDNEDGHLRITRGDNFRLFGGSEQTHEVMQETAVKFNERLRDRGKRLEEITKAEFRDIAHEIGLSDKNLPPPPADD
ncbi:MAG: hypothetical protein ISS74_04550 [Planctomycetes bacterium]|nr:hypothetical protein [Planctomycetota bacterium]